MTDKILIDRATLEKLLTELLRMSNACELEGDKHPDGNKWHRLSDDAAKAITAGRAAQAQQELPQKERPDFMAGYDAGMADAKRMAQKGEPVAQARLGMKDGLAMALSVVELYGMKGDVIYREIAKLRDGIAAAPSPVEQRCTYCDGTGDVHGIDGEWRGSCPCAAAPAPQAQQGEPSRPDIIEKLSYHRRERNDMTLDNCLTYLQTGGWHKVHGRTERNMVLQLTDLLAAAPAPQVQSILASAVLALNTLWNKSSVKDSAIADQLAVCRVLAESDDDMELTDAQILALWEETYVQRGWTGIEFARAIERAHGIGVKP